MPERTRPRRAETRRRVLDAAFEVFSAHGIAASSLSEVAAAAGLTKGAVYSSFASKDELVLALMEEHVAQRVDAALTNFTENVDTDHALADMAAALVAGMRADVAWHRLLAEYFAMASHDPARRDGLRQRRREAREAITRVLVRVADGLGIELPLAPAEMAVVLLALSNGLAVETDIDPEAVPADLLGRVLTLIAGDAVAKIQAAARR
jgi:AcrR family transcriptional regulator